MKHLIVGAGGTFAEALALGVSSERCPPLLRDFAQKTWPYVYNPHPVLEVYLRELGFTDLGADPRELFYALERDGRSNIERFLEFAWIRRNEDWKFDEEAPPARDYISGLRVVAHTEVPEEPVPELAPRWWTDLLYNGIGKPLTLMMSQCFFENGVGWRDLNLTKSIASRLEPGDLVLNLNYDTVFELALEQLNKPFAYAPNAPKVHELTMCKPHGSLNMVMNAECFAFGQPEWLGMPEPPGFRSYSGFIPPRLNKSYTEHPASQVILAPVINREPDEIIMWGVGLTESDVELVSIYRRWSQHVKRISIINPHELVAAKAAELLGSLVVWFESPDTWANTPFQ